MSPARSRTRKPRLRKLVNAIAAFGVLAITATALVVTQPSLRDSCPRHDPPDHHQRLRPRRPGLHLRPRRPGHRPARLVRRRRHVPPLAHRRRDAGRRPRRLDRRPSGRAVEDHPAAQDVRPGVLLLRQQALVQGRQRRPAGPAGGAEPERPEPQQALQLDRVHAQQRRPVDQQHPGRLPLRPVPDGPAEGGRHGDQHRDAQAQRLPERRQRPGRHARLDQPGAARARRLAAARPGPRARDRDRADGPERPGRLRRPGVGQVHEREPHRRALLLRPGRPVHGPRAERRHAVHQRLGRLRHGVPQAVERLRSSAATTISRRRTTTSAPSPARCVPASTARRS